MTKNFWGVIVAVIVVLGLIFAFTHHKAGAPSASQNASLTQHIEGQGSSGVTLVEYGDYQCPACGDYFEPLQQVFEKYQQQIHFQFRNFPLTSLHPNAFAGARAAEAAGLQNKYWQMHDKLYQENVVYYLAQQQGKTYNTWINASDPLSYFTQYAQQLGLNVAKFKQDYASDQVNNAINADMAEGNKLGIDGTPTFILDGQKITNPSPTLQAFSQVLDAEMAKKAGHAAPTPSATSSGTPGTNQPAPQQTKAKP